MRGVVMGIQPVALAELQERIETLESRAHGFMDRLREIDGYAERLEALELNQSMAHAANAMTLAKHEERVRQSRWNAKVDAVLPAMLMRYPKESHAFAVAQAEDMADRAHGPLEVKADNDAPTKLRDVLNIEGMRSLYPEVDALVKAAQRAHAELDALGRMDMDQSLLDIARDLLNALVPFEAPCAK